MAAPGDTYERELKSILAGEKKSIDKMIKTCNDFERRWYNSLVEHPFLVIRAAGSLGVDLVALRWDFSFPIEVKSSSEDVMHFSRNPRLSEQANKMRDECSDPHLLPIYAYRLKNQKGDPWRIFTLPIEHELRGNMGLLQRRIPKISMNGNGNLIMRWEEGIKLTELIEYMQFEA